MSFISRFGINASIQTARSKYGQQTTCTQTSFVPPDSPEITVDEQYPLTSGFRFKETKSNESNISDPDPLLEPLKDIDIVERLIQNTEAELETIKCDVNQYLCILKECKHEKCINFKQFKLLDKNEEKFEKQTDHKTTHADVKSKTSTPRSTTSERKGPVVPKCSTRIDELSKAKRQREKYSNDKKSNLSLPLGKYDGKDGRKQNVEPKFPKNKEVQTDLSPFQSLNSTIISEEIPAGPCPSEDDFHSIKETKSSEQLIKEPPKICAAEVIEVEPPQPERKAKSSKQLIKEHNEKPPKICAAEVTEVEPPQPQRTAFLHDQIHAVLEDLHVRRNPLSVQIMPAVDIKRPLVTQKMPNVVITPSYSTNDQENIHTRDNVKYLEISHENVKPKQIPETLDLKSTIQEIQRPETCKISELKENIQEKNIQQEEIPKQKQIAKQEDIIPLNEPERQNNVTIREELNLNVNDIPSVKTLREIQNYLEQRCALIRQRLDDERELRPGEYISLKWQLNKPPKWQATREIAQNDIEFSRDNNIASPSDRTLLSIAYDPTSEINRSNTSTPRTSKFCFKKVVKEKKPVIGKIEEDQNEKEIDKQIVPIFPSPIGGPSESNFNAEPITINYEKPMPAPISFSQTKHIQCTLEDSEKEIKQPQEEIIKAQFDTITNNLTIPSITQCSKKDKENQKSKKICPTGSYKKLELNVETNNFSFPGKESIEKEIRSVNLDCTDEDKSNQTVMKKVELQDSAVQYSPSIAERGLTATFRNKKSVPPSSSVKTIGTEVRSVNLDCNDEDKSNQTVTKPEVELQDSAVQCSPSIAERGLTATFRNKKIVPPNSSVKTIGTVVRSVNLDCNDEDESNQTDMKPKVQVQDSAVQCSPSIAERGVTPTLRSKKSVHPSSSVKNTGTVVTEDDLGLSRPVKPKAVIYKDYGTQKSEPPKVYKSTGFGVIEEQLLQLSPDSTKTNASSKSYSSPRTDTFPKNITLSDLTTQTNLSPNQVLKPARKGERVMEEQLFQSSSTKRFMEEQLLQLSSSSTKKDASTKSEPYAKTVIFPKKVTLTDLTTQTSISPKKVIKPARKEEELRESPSGKTKKDATTLSDLTTQKSISPKQTKKPTRKVKQLLDSSSSSSNKDAYVKNESIPKIDTKKSLTTQRSSVSQKQVLKPARKEEQLLESPSGSSKKVANITLTDFTTQTSSVSQQRVLKSARKEEQLLKSPSGSSKQDASSKSGSFPKIDTFPENITLATLTTQTSISPKQVSKPARKQEKEKLLIPKESEHTKCVSCNMPDFQFSRIPRPRSRQNENEQSVKDSCQKVNLAKNINIDNYRRIRSAEYAEIRASNAQMYKNSSSSETPSPKINKLKFKRLQHKKSATPSSTSSYTTDATDPTDYISDGISISEGEVKLPCECSTSIGEIHLCHFANNIRKKCNDLKDHPEKVAQQAFHTNDFNISHQRKYNDNWVSYYVNKANLNISSGEIEIHSCVSSATSISPSD